VNRAISRLFLGVPAILAVAAAVVGADQAPGIASQRIGDSATQVFGLKTVQAAIHPTPKTWLVTGSAPDPQLDGLNDLVIGGAVLTDGTWRVRLLQSYPISFGCTNSIAAKLVPGSRAIVTNCLNGGSDGQSFFTVSGVQPGPKIPVVMLANTCGQTHAAARGSDLVVSSAELSGGGKPPPSQPTFVFRWSGSGRSGGLTLLPSDPPDFKKYCTPPDDYFPNA
jgi:hypothetical protein